MIVYPGICTFNGIGIVINSMTGMGTTRSDVCNLFAKLKKMTPHTQKNVLYYS